MGTVSLQKIPEHSDPVPQEPYFLVFENRSCRTGSGCGSNLMYLLREESVVKSVMAEEHGCRTQIGKASNFPHLFGVHTHIQGKLIYSKNSTSKVPLENFTLSGLSGFLLPPSVAILKLTVKLPCTMFAAVSINVTSI